MLAAWQQVIHVFTNSCRTAPHRLSNVSTTRYWCSANGHGGERHGLSPCDGHVRVRSATVLSETSVIATCVPARLDHSKGRSTLLIIAPASRKHFNGIPTFNHWP